MPDALVRRAPRLVVLTGAGYTTASGIPDYRDESGARENKPPAQFQDFVGCHATGQRSWARSLVGCARAAAARPAVAHQALMVLSGYRFCLAAAEMGKPVAVVNRGRTRADDLADLKVEGDCGEILNDLVQRLD